MNRVTPSFFLFAMSGLLVLAVLALWSCARWTASRSDAEGTADDLNACRKLAEQIKSLRTQPLQATTEARSATELARLVEQTARAAHIPPTNLVQIDPQPARRVANAPYKEQPTHIELRDVSLEQLLVFLHAMATDRSAMNLTDLRLSAPREEGTSATTETWLAEMTLTQVVFAP